MKNRRLYIPKRLTNNGQFNHRESLIKIMPILLTNSSIIIKN